jgi:CheY-like chemotaxis protein
MAEILAVDDSPAILMTVEGYLSANGHSVKTAESAVTALGMLRNGDRPSILLTDIVMPGSIDGIGLAQIVRDNYPDIRILLMTGWSYDDNHGFPVIEKPFKLAVLGEWVETHLNGPMSEMG